MAQRVLLGILAALADRQEGDFKPAARKMFDERLGQPWPGTATEGMKIAARKEFVEILELVKSERDPTRRYTLRRRFLDWLQAG
jgi:hypothetical protein